MQGLGLGIFSARGLGSISGLVTKLLQAIGCKSVGPGRTPLCGEGD